VAIARARLLDVEVERPKRIDQYIDYFGSGGKGGRGVDQSPIGREDDVP
jgi:hypothetical protein